MRQLEVDICGEKCARFNGVPVADEFTVAQDKVKFNVLARSRSCEYCVTITIISMSDGNW